MPLQQSPWIGLGPTPPPVQPVNRLRFLAPSDEWRRQWMVAPPATPPAAPEPDLTPQFPPMGLDGIPPVGAMTRAEAEANPQPLPDVAAMMGLAPEASAPAPAQVGGSGIMSRDQYAELMDRINASGLESIRMQKEGVEKLERGMGDYQKLPTQLDLTPLAALVDQWSGSNLVKSYKAPESPQERMAAIQQMEQAVQKARQGVSQADLELLQRQLQNRTAIEDRDARRREEALRRAELEQQRLERQGIRAAEKKIEWGTAWQKQYGDKLSGIGTFAQNLRTAKDIIDKYRGVPPVGSEDYKVYESAMAQVLTNYNRDVAGLGALAGADLQLLTSATGGKESALKEWFSEKFKGGYEGTSKTMGKLLEATDKTVENIGKTTNKTYGGLLDPLFEDKRLQYKEMRGLKEGAPSGGINLPDRSAIEAALASRGVR